MFDAILVVSFGGPEQQEEVLPFLENVTRGRNVPRERLLEVAEHYYHFGGKSPINDQCRALIGALRSELDQHGIRLPVYWGNRNWRPLLDGALEQMRRDGVKNALALVTSAYSSYSGCRQYRDNIAEAQARIGAGVPKIDKLRVFYNHPGFIEACAARVREAMEGFSPAELDNVQLIATAHSIPCSLAQTSDYEKQLRETARLVAEATGLTNWELVFQSRSGPPSQPWTGPDVVEHLRGLPARGIRNVIIAPLGFISDHLEVLYDLDVEAADAARELGIKMVRAGTAGVHPAFIKMLRELISERLSEGVPRLAIGYYGPNHDVCPHDCCPAPPKAGRPHVSEAPVVLQQP
jgi:ferrochelatase